MSGEDTIGKSAETLTNEEIDAELKLHRQTLLGGNVAARGNIHVRIGDLERVKMKRSCCEKCDFTIDYQDMGHCSNSPKPNSIYKGDPSCGANQKYGLTAIGLLKAKQQRVYVCIENYGCINQGAHLYDTEAEALEWWKGYTEMEIPTTEAEAEALGQHEDYGEVRVYRVAWDPDTKAWLSQDVIWEKARNRRRCPKCGNMMDYRTPSEEEEKFTPFYTCSRCSHKEAEG